MMTAVLQGTELLSTGRKTCPEILTKYSQKTLNIIHHGTERDERWALGSLESVGASFLKGLTSPDKQYRQLGSCLHVLAGEYMRIWSMTVSMFTEICEHCSQYV